MHHSYAEQGNVISVHDLCTIFVNIQSLLHPDRYFFYDTRSTSFNVSAILDQEKRVQQGYKQEECEDNRMKRAKLQAARYRKGLSQEALAEQIGVSRTAIGQWENGHTTPYPLYVGKLCAFFDVDDPAALDLQMPQSKMSSSAKPGPEPIESSSYYDSPSEVHLSHERQENIRTLETAMPFLPSLSSPSSESNLWTEPLTIPSSVRSGEKDWATWFGFKLAQLITIVDHWQGQAVYADRLQTLLDREIIMFDTFKPQNEQNAYILSRRQMLIAFASTMALGSSFQAEFTSVTAIEKALSRGAASITAGWHLLKGSELPVVEQTLSTYLLTLVTLANQPSSYQKMAAKLASQAYRLYGIVALHRNNLQARELYCQQALYYSEIAANPSSQVSALISLASTYYYSKKPEKAAHTYQKALLHSDNIPPLQRSRLHAELAVVYAQQKHEQEALHSLHHAQEYYPEHPENDPSFLYAEFSPSSFILEQGLTHLALAHHFPDRQYDQMAWETFAQIEALQGNSGVPERILLEILNKKAEAALIARNLEGFYACIKQGIQGAIDLQSKQRMQEAIEVYDQAKGVWGDEARVKSVVELFPPVVQKGSK